MGDDARLVDATTLTEADSRLRRIEVMRAEAVFDVDDYIRPVAVAVDHKRLRGGEQSG